MRSPFQHILLVQKLLGWLGLTLGGWLGWMVGQPISLAAALLFSAVGTGFGLYVGRRIAQEYF